MIRSDNEFQSPDEDSFAPKRPCQLPSSPAQYRFSPLTRIRSPQSQIVGIAGILAIIVSVP